MSDATNLTPGEWQLWRSFLFATRRLDVALEHDLREAADISTAEFGVLIELLRAPDRQLRAGELAHQLLWEKSRVSHQVSRMEKRGLVERRLCNVDARGTWVGLTADGSRAVLAAIRPHAASIRGLFFDVLDPTELSAIASAASKIAP